MKKNCASSRLFTKITLLCLQPVIFIHSTSLPNDPCPPHTHAYKKGALIICVVFVKIKPSKSGSTDMPRRLLCVCVWRYTYFLTRHSATRRSPAGSRIFYCTFSQLTRCVEIPCRTGFCWAGLQTQGRCGPNAKYVTLGLQHTMQYSHAVHF